MADALVLGASSNGVRVQVPSPAPDKNANIDTVSVNISVLILCPKSLQTKHFQHFIAFFYALCIAASSHSFLRSSVFLYTSANDLSVEVFIFGGVFIFERRGVHRR